MRFEIEIFLKRFETFYGGHRIAVRPYRPFSGGGMMYLFSSSRQCEKMALAGFGTICQNLGQNNNSMTEFGDKWW